MSLELYFDYVSQPSRAVVHTAHLLGLDAKLNWIQIFKGENKAPSYLQVNPKGSVPCMVEDDFKLAESASIMRYLCNSKGGPEHLYPGADSKKRAQIDALLDFSGTSFRPVITV